MNFQHQTEITAADRPLCLASEIKLLVLLHPPNPTPTMSDDNEYNIESADAGASATIPMEAGQIKKGG